MATPEEVFFYSWNDIDQKHKFTQLLIILCEGYTSSKHKG